MCIRYKEKTGQELQQEAIKLGVVTEDIFPTQERGASDVANAKLQERIRSAKNARYARNTWIIALISAITALFSVIAAWCAVLK